MKGWRNAPLFSFFFSCDKATLKEGMSIGPSVCPSVGNQLFFSLLGATYAVYTALFLCLSLSPPPPSWLQSPPPWLQCPARWLQGTLRWRRAGSKPLPAASEPLPASFEALSAGSQALPLSSAMVIIPYRATAQSLSN